jgi:hypothetical protein
MREFMSEENEEIVTILRIEGELISNKKLKKTWKRVTDAPFPKGKIKAMIISDDEAGRIFKILRESPNIYSKSVFEYGVQSEADLATTAAFAIPVGFENARYFLIVIRRDICVSIEENLEHELNHIAKGDIKLNVEKQPRGKVVD